MALQKIKQEDEMAIVEPAGSSLDKTDQEYTPHGMAAKEDQGAWSRRSKRIQKEVGKHNII